MDDDFSKFLGDMRSKTGKLVKSMAKVGNSTLVHPQVWKDETEAKTAASDWRYREMASAEKDLKRIMRGN